MAAGGRVEEACIRRRYPTPASAFAGFALVEAGGAFAFAGFGARRGRRRFCLRGFWGCRWKAGLFVARQIYEKECKYGHGERKKWALLRIYADIYKGAVTKRAVTSCRPTPPSSCGVVAGPQPSSCCGLLGGRFCGAFAYSFLERRQESCHGCGTIDSQP